MMSAKTRNISLFLILVGVTGMIGLLLANPLDGEPRSDFLQFLGRFHPVTLHLPIAFVGMLALMELLVSACKMEQLKGAKGFVLLLSILSTILAVVTGFLLAFSSGSDEPLVLSHMRNGVLLAIACLGLGALKLFDSKRVAVVGYRLLLCGSVLLVAYASHEGGSITHGRDYLTRYMPDPLRVVLGLEVEQKATVAKVEDLVVYRDLIHPMMEQNCLSCHNTDKTKGELNLESYAGHLAGGEIGPAIVPHDLDASELYFRVTLPRDDEEFMPPDEKPPLSEAEIALIEWWIEQGAPAEATLGELADLSAAVETYVADVFSKMLTPEEIERLNEERAALYAALADLQSDTGVLIEPVEANALEFSIYAHSVAREFEDKSLLPFEDFADRIVSADFSSSKISDEAISSISKFSNLKHLVLSKTQLTGKALGELAKLQKLESLNLYGSSLEADRLPELAKLVQLKKLYLFQTELHTDELLEELRSKLPDCEVL
ncbi:c-type cytochrome domain-containing protein [Pelagicoccus mobilis]|uniref:Cytochrome c domain-containing protein n=1 Tax=Pelagicoccus mobilis TaxID=415221 RepID=A0A934RT17_9BACT|nr:c-type cytochrome domain-containing protein [Pelagicoccus mobilis]MBK1877060.1 hypothetical protein [Pelagicoccus mobilis]